MTMPRMLTTATLSLLLGLSGGALFAQSESALEEAAIKADEAAEAEAKAAEAEAEAAVAKDKNAAKEAAKRGEEALMKSKQ